MSNIPHTAFRGYSLVKRLFDIFLAIIYILMLTPPLLVVALAIKIDSPGPMLFRQIRLGRHGKPFGYLKFRTMVVGAEQFATRPIFEFREDPRISRVGRFLRRAGIDELPTILNVLHGDMSFVGPRAALPLEVAHYSERERRRLELKPGITGYWQVFGRMAGDTNFNRMVEMDLEYADKQSLMLDLKIIVRTMVLNLRGEAAY